MSLLTVFMAHRGMDAMPLITDCALATAIFALVMYMAVLPRGGRAVKKLLPIRSQLSIIACILTLGHNLAYGKTYFIMLLTSPEKLRGNLLCAAVISVVLMSIMLPLFITSFPAIRRRMRPKKWKRVQRLAYGFYGLVYVHVMFLARELKDPVNILVYSGVFLTYGILRIRKGMKKQHPSAAGKITTGLAISATAMVCLMLLPEVPSQQPLEPVHREPVTYIDGTYFGEAEGYVGTTQVAVTVSEGMIRSVIVISSEDDLSYVEDAKTLIPALLEAQHTGVDTVSGATYTSCAILDAVEVALESGT